MRDRADTAPPTSRQLAAPATSASAVLPKRTRSRQTLIGWGLALIVFAALLVYSWINAQGSVTALFNGIFGSRGLIRGSAAIRAPRPVVSSGRGCRRCATTFACAILATALAAILSILMLPFGARNIAPARWVYELTRAVVAIMRAIPELIMLVLFSFVFSFSPFATVVALTFHGVGIKGKLFAEAVEEMDMTPVDALRVAGASRLQVFIHAVLPGVGSTLAGPHAVPA